MKKKILALVLSLLLCPVTLAKPYKAFNDKKLFIVKKNGSKAIDFAVLDKAVDQLWQHAREYPTRFDNNSEKEQAKKDVIILSKMIDYLISQVVKDKDKALKQHLTLLEARVAVMAYNFDYTKARDLADKRYEMLIAQTDDPALKAEYGAFLANSARTKKAEKLFKSALDAGDKSTLYGLAMLSITENNRKQAISYLKDYLNYSPTDTRAKQLLKALEDDSIVIKRNNSAGN